MLGWLKSNNSATFSAQLWTSLTLEHFTQIATLFRVAVVTYKMPLSAHSVSQVSEIQFELKIFDQRTLTKMIRVEFTFFPPSPSHRRKCCFGICNIQDDAESHLVFSLLLETLLCFIRVQFQIEEKKWEIRSNSKRNFKGTLKNSYIYRRLT